MKSVFTRPESLNAVNKFLETKNRDTSDTLNEKSVTITSSSRSKNLTKEDRCVSVMRSITLGMNEKSIIREVRDHYTSIHPTQKPVRLLERLLAIVIPQDKELKDIVIADFFGGSMSTIEACYNIGANGMAVEIDKEYFDLGKKRIDELLSIPKLF